MKKICTFTISLLLMFLFLCSGPMARTEEAAYPSIHNLKLINPGQADTSAVNRLERVNNGYRLQNPKHTALFSREGFLFVPHHSGLYWHWHLTHLGDGETASSGIDSSQLRPDNQKPGVISYMRGSVKEQYVLRQKSIEQQFVISDPLNLSGKDLVIEGRIRSAGTFEETEKGWLWVSDKGVVSLGQVYVYDAEGKRIAASMTATAESTLIRIDGEALALANYPVTVDPEVGTNDFRISDMGSTDGNTNYSAFNPAVAYNSTNNEYLVVWEGDDDTGSLVDGEFEIFGQRINAVTGDEVGSDFRISDMGSTDGNTNYGAHNPSVAYNSTNNEYLVVWEGDDDTSPLVDGEFEIFGQRINAATGAEVGTNDFRISDMGPNGNTNYSANKPDVSYNSTNNVYLVVWEGDDNTSPLVDGEFEIFGQRLNAATGAEVGTNDFRISDMGPNGNTNYEAKNPAVAYNSTNNEYLVVWHGDDDTGSLVDGEYEIYYQRLNAATGAEVGTNDFRVSDMGGTGNTTYNAYKPDVAYNSSYNVYMVVWEGDDDPGAQPTADDEYEIYNQLIRGSDGAEIGTNDFRITSAGPDGDPDYDSYDASVAYNNIEDEYLVTWSATDWSPLILGEFEIHAQRHRGSDGWETPPYDFRLSDMGPNEDTDYDAYNPAIAFSSTEHQFLIVWEGDDNTGSLVDEEFEIFGQQWELSSLSTSAVVGSPFYVTPVADAAVTVPYTIPTGAYYPGNVFTAYLSDSSGDFSSETAIGTRVATDEGSINALIPAGTATGSGYRIRVKSSDPPVTAPDNGSDLTIVLFTNSIAPTATQNISVGVDGTTLAVTESPAADSRQWKYSTTSGGPYTNDIAGATATTYTPNFASVGTYYVVCASTKGLATVISNEVQINVLVQTISTGAITGSPFLVSLLQDAAVSVPYTITGSFNPGNVFTAYLSDAFGSFASGITIGSRTATGGGTINALIPAGTATGSGYRIKVESSNPPLTGSDNGSDLTIILFTNSIAPTATQSISIGVDGTTLTVSESPAADSRQWKYSTTSGGPYTNDIAGATATTYTPNFDSLGTYYVVCASTKGLITVTSNEVLINVGIPPTISITNPQADSYVSGTVALEASADDDVGISLIEFFVDDIKIGDGIITLPYPFDNRENTVRGIPTFDFSGATAVFINSGNRLRKIDAYGNITKVIQEDSEVHYLQKNPQGQLIILFAEPQLLEDGNHYSLIMANPPDNTLEGIDKSTSSLVYDFPRTEGIQFDENENMFYISSQADGSVSIRKHMEPNRIETLFRENIIIRDWVVKPDSTVIIGAEGLSRRMEWLIVISPDNEISWLPDSSEDLERRAAFPDAEDYTHLFREKGDRLWPLFRHPERVRAFVNSEVAEAGVFDSIHQTKDSSGRIYIAGNKDGMNQLIVCDPSKNSRQHLLYNNIKIDHLDVLENGDVYFSGYSPGENKYLAAVLEYEALSQDSGNYTYKELTLLMGEPSGFAALEPHEITFETHSESENHRAINATYTLDWDTSFYSAGPHELKAVAHDTDGLTEEDSINVNVVKLDISLSATREIEQAWIIRKEYAKLEIDVENADLIPVSKYVIYRREAGQTYSTLVEIPGSEVQDGLYTFYDITIEKDVTYTYRVTALDATGTVIGISEERNI